MCRHDEAKFTDTRKFFVRVDYSYERQHLRFDVTVWKDFDGRLSFDAEKGGGGSF